MSDSFVNETKDMVMNASEKEIGMELPSMSGGSQLSAMMTKTGGSKLEYSEYSGGKSRKRRNSKKSKKSKKSNKSKKNRKSKK